ncbi:hypothetical protein SAMN05444678_11640 [Sphingomonas sp. YR710]|nr:hypothetical protein SAMN05444678_11640 [Sphingomonas sp. YR710]
MRIILMRAICRVGAALSNDRPAIFCPFSSQQSSGAQFPAMRCLALSLLLITASAAHAEDAEHRADRLRTIQLNERAKAASDRRDRNLGHPTDGYRAARARYEREMDDWRRQVAACREGDYRACDR